ncbi:MAG: sigma-70 family RNA polymerase sigma factor [Armatimonadota bacterium]
MLTDAELMVRVQHDDPEAFALLVQRHKPWLTRLLYHLFWNREEAEDGSQEVLLRLWLARGRYEPTASLKTFLFTIARNYWHNRSTRVIRKHPAVSLEDQFGPTARVVIEELADRSPTPEQQVMERYEVFHIRRAVDQLPEKQRLVFILSQYGDMRYAEIAELLGIPEGTVKSRMATAVETLRRGLKASSPSLRHFLTC